MPLLYQQNINLVTKIGVWHITEGEDYFKVPLQREITHWHKRLQHLAGRLLLKELYPEFPLALIQVADTRKPFLENEPFHFSISHCGDYAAVIVSRENHVGVDVENVTGKIGVLLHKFMNPGEQSLLDPNAILATATLCWCVKETIFKWIGSGGVDYKRDILIREITGDNAGTVHCIFKQDTFLKVNFLFFNGHYLTWLVT